MRETSQFRLLFERRFAPFFGVQFLGALNDNLFKQALVILLAYQTATYTSMSTDVLQNMAQALFVLPFFLFSATAGQFADKYEKSRLILITVAIELLVMMLGAAGFFLRSLELLLVALFLGGTQSALFGPIKYSILPQQLKEHELVGGNALVETGTVRSVRRHVQKRGRILPAAPPGAQEHPRPARDAPVRRLPRLHVRRHQQEVRIVLDLAGHVDDARRADEAAGGNGVAGTLGQIAARNPVDRRVEVRADVLAGQLVRPLPVVGELPLEPLDLVAWPRHPPPAPARLLAEDAEHARPVQGFQLVADPGDLDGGVDAEQRHPRADHLLDRASSRSVPANAATRPPQSM